MMFTEALERTIRRRPAASRPATSSRPASPCVGPIATLLAHLARRAMIWIGGYLGVALIIYLASLVAT